MTTPYEAPYEAPFTAESRPERCNGRDDHEVYRRSDGSEFCRQCGALLKSAQQDSGLTIPEQRLVSGEQPNRVAPSGGDSGLFDRHPRPWRVFYVDEGVEIVDTLEKSLLLAIGYGKGTVEAIVAAVNATPPATPAPREETKRTEWVLRDRNGLLYCFGQGSGAFATREEAERKSGEGGDYTAIERRRPATLSEQLADARAEIERLKDEAAKNIEAYRRAVALVDDAAQRTIAKAEAERDAALRFEVSDAQRARAVDVIRKSNTTLSHQQILHAVLAALREGKAGGA